MPNDRREFYLSILGLLALMVIALLVFGFVTAATVIAGIIFVVAFALFVDAVFLSHNDKDNTP